MLSKKQKGLLACIASQGLWGSGILFWPLLAYLNTLSILSLRIICSFVFAIILISYTKRFRLVKSLFTEKKIRTNLILASAFIAGNWGVYTYAINSGKAIEVSLGYYLTPLMSIALGRIFFNDILNKNQLIAVTIVLCGVAYGILSYGDIPYYGLAIGFTFAIYGFLHKIINADAISILCAETLILLPFSLAWLFLTEPDYGLIHYPLKHYLLLSGTVFYTGIPLMLFSFATVTVRFTTIGFILYTAPSINFLLAVFHTHEPIKTSDYITFPLVWIALLIYTLDMLYKNKKVR